MIGCVCSLIEICTTKIQCVLKTQSFTLGKIILKLTKLFKMKFLVNLYLKKKKQKT